MMGLAWARWMMAAAVAMGAAWVGANQAVVVRAHPWLTRGVGRESLVGIRFQGEQGAWGGGLGTVTFTVRLEGCAREDLGAFHLWRMPFNCNYAFYEPRAVRLDGDYGTLTETVSADGGVVTLTFTGVGGASEGAPDWIYPHTPGRVESDYVWLTADVAETIDSGARLWVGVASPQVSIGGCVYDVANGAAQAPHRVYPWVWRVGAYLRADRMKGVNGRGSDILDDAGDLRLASLTQVYLSTVKVVYRSETDTFELDLDRAGEDYATGLRRLTALRAAHPHLRVFASLDKGAWIWRDSDSSKGGSHAAFALGHAAGDKYRAQFVQAIVRMMEDYALDGLDIDWEYPNSNTASTTVDNGEFEKYGLLMRDLAEVFFDRGWELAMCVNQTGWQIPGGEVCAAADFVNAMAYGPWPAFHGNGVMTQGINQCLNRGVPRRRIVVGQSIYANASYNYGWDECAAFVRQAHADPFDRFDCDTVRRAWSYNNKSGAYVNFTGPSTYRAKCARAKAEGYGGVMSWGYYSDTAWAADDRLSLGRNQAQVVWPHDRWPEPPRDADGFVLLDSEEDWFWLRDNPDNDARLVADIAFAHDPLPIPAFDRTLDGGGHTLTLGPDVWICDFGDAALFGTLSGAVRDLTVVLQGRVVSLADRANDTTVSDASTLVGTPHAALLAGALAGATLERVTLRVEAGAEIQGAVQTAVAAANLYAETPAANVLRDVRAEIAGAVRNNATTSSGAAFHPVNTLVGGLVGWVGGPAQGGNVLERCAVSLAPTARVANETGEQDAAGGAVGHLHNKADPRIVGLDVRWADGAEVVGRAVTECSPMPWCATYYARELPAGSVGGRVIPAPGAEGAFRARWPTYWLEPFAPFGRPGFGLFLR